MNTADLGLKFMCASDIPKTAWAGAGSFCLSTASRIAFSRGGRPLILRAPHDFDCVVSPEYFDVAEEFVRRATHEFGLPSGAIDLSPWWPHDGLIHTADDLSAHSIIVEGGIQILEPSRVATSKHEMHRPKDMGDLQTLEHSLHYF